MALYRFAKLNVEMEPRYEKLRARAERYRVAAGEPDLRLAIDERLALRLRARYPGLPDDTMEYMALGGLFYNALLSFGGMLLHAAAVGYRGRAYLFTAPCGTGKSTHAAAWLQLLGEEAYIINDDKPALRTIDGVLCACGTPFSGKTAKSENRCLPVGGICLLTRGTENRIWRISPREALPALVAGTQHIQGAANGERLLERLSEVAAAAPFYKMTCTVGREAAETAFRAMVIEEGSNEA